MYCEQWASRRLLHMFERLNRLFPLTTFFGMMEGLSGLSMRLSCLEMTLCTDFLPKDLRYWRRLATSASSRTSSSCSYSSVLSSRPESPPVPAGEEAASFSSGRSASSSSESLSSESPTVKVEESLEPAEEAPCFVCFFLCSTVILRVIWREGSNDIVG